MNLIEELIDTKEQTLQLFDLSEEDLNKSYAPDKWNNRQLLHHLADAETVLYERIKRIIAGPTQVIWGFDQDAWAQNLDYHKFPLSLNKKIYAAVRESVIYLVKEYYEPLSEKQFIHSETGIRTLKDECNKIAFHNRHHLKQLYKALRR